MGLLQDVVARLSWLRWWWKPCWNDCSCLFVNFFRYHSVWRGSCGCLFMLHRLRIYSSWVVLDCSWLWVCGEFCWSLECTASKQVGCRLHHRLFYFDNSLRDDQTSDSQSIVFHFEQTPCICAKCDHLSDRKYITCTWKTQSKIQTKHINYLVGCVPRKGRIHSGLRMFLEHLNTATT